MVGLGGELDVGVDVDVVAVVVVGADDVVVAEGLVMAGLPPPLP